MTQMVNENFYLCVTYILEKETSKYIVYQVVINVREKIKQEKKTEDFAILSICLIVKVSFQQRL